MVNRLIKIAVLTGAAHVFTIITLKFLSQRVSAGEISSIGEIDALLQLIINIVSFGLQLSAVRNIAAVEDWSGIYKETQIARNTLAFMLMPAAFLYFIKAPYQYFLLAPIFALNGDYALYGRGKPVQAAMLSFWRVFIPSLILIVFSYWQQQYLVPAYVISTVGVYIVTSLIITKWLKSSYWFWPQLKSLQRYAESLYLGIATISNYIIGLGLIVVAAMFYNDTIVAASYLGLKLYMIYKGVIRIINQAFIKEMLDDAVGLKVDQLSIFAGSGFLALLSIFPQSFISIFFNKQYEQHQGFLLLVGGAGLAVSLLTSFTTRSILKHKDRAYAMYSSTAVIICFTTMIVLSYFVQDTLSIGISLIIGEAIITWGLYKMNTDVQISGRIYFLLEVSLLLLLPLMARIIGGDEIITMVIGMSLFTIGGGWLMRKRLLNIPTAKTNSI